jgi:hypothetical protein
MQNLFHPLKPRVVTRNQLIAEQYIIVRGTPYGDWQLG